MRLNTVRTSLRAGSVLMLSGLLAACGSGGSVLNATKVASTATCTAAQPTIHVDTPTIAILGEVGPKLAAYDQDLSIVVSASQTMKARVIVNGVSSDTMAPNLLSNAVMLGEGNNRLLRTRNLTCKINALNSSIDTLKMGTTPSKPDAFDALNALAGNLAGNPSKAPVDVLLLTSLAARGGGVDLSDPATLANPVAAVNKLASNGLIPSCRGWRIYAVSPAASLSDVRAAKLRDFWLAYVHKCGGALVAWTEHLATFPLTGSIAPADTSQIQVQRTPKTITATLGSDVLFAYNSAELQRAAATPLQQLLALALPFSGRIVITGYVDPVVPGKNFPSDLALSVARAVAVKSWLVAHGVPGPRITTIGMGAADAVYPHPQTEAQRAVNRRVVTVIDTDGK